MPVLEVLRRAEADAHAAYLLAQRLGSPDDERRRLRREWKMAFDTLAAELVARAQAYRSASEASR